MKIGIYEQIINQLFEEKISSMDRTRFYIGERNIDKSEVAKLLSMYLTNIFEQVLSSITDQSEDDDEGTTKDTSVSNGIALANSIINKLVHDFHLNSGNLLSAQAKILTAVIDKTQNDYPDLAKRLEEIMPLKGLVNGALFTGKGMKMYTELQKEIMSADEIRLMVSFIKKRGLVLIYPQLKEFTERGGCLKVITTTYMQATDFEAIKQLSALKNTEIKITYDESSERLHAKAYIFLRNTGFNTAYVGSSNLSAQALDTGAEWNVKMAQMEQPRMMKTILDAFDASWWDESYEPYIPEQDDERLKAALHGEDIQEIDYSNLSALIRPFDYQKEILERLQVERNVRGHWRNLVVAATGTGKTVMAASDYKAFAESHDRARLLFVAHREEILRQSINTFRQVLCDYNFGEKWFGDEKPSNYEHLFASKDMLNNHLEDMQISPEYYDYIVIDEVHHVEADSYRKIVDYFKPQILLGLTATPERMDGKDITQDFDGTISAEIRLDDALNKGLLAPFFYYGITDSVDYTEVGWERGHYVASELSHIYTYNDARTQVVLKALERYLDNVRKVRALCFCVDQQHAKYMAAKFTLCGLKAEVLTSENSAMRQVLYGRLKRQEINYLFVVDMFNEGVDIPEVDTILFLRPTESLTIFIQQFGRGLRKAEGKDHVDIFDFVGNCRAEFNYTDRMRAMIGRTSMSVKEEMERGCPHLPLGCKIILEPKAKEYIMDNINNAIKRFSLAKLTALIKNFEHNHSASLSLANFVNIYGVSLDRIYKGGHTWYQLLHTAGRMDAESVYADELSRAVFRKWLSTDSYTYFSFIDRLANQSFKCQVDRMNIKEQKMLLMLYYDLFEEAGKFNSLQTMVNALAADECFCAEIKEVMPILINQCKSLELNDNSQLFNFPLKLHGVYTKAQIQVAIGTSTLSKKSPSREGAERNKQTRVEAMFVDIIKNREEGSTTNYDDKALTPLLFQWDTQNSVTPQTNTGQAYINQTQTMLLFVREQKNFAEDKSRTMGYVYLGRVTLNNWEYKNLGTRYQMQIIWNMLEPIPASVMHYARIREVI